MGSGCPQDCSQNVDSFVCQHQSFRQVSQLQLMTVWEMLINRCHKMSHSGMLKEVERWSAFGADLPPKINRFFLLVGPIMTPSFSQINWLLLQQSCWETHKWDGLHSLPNFVGGGNDISWLTEWMSWSHLVPVITSKCGTTFLQRR